MKTLITIVYLVLTTLGLTFFKLGGSSIAVAIKNGFSLKIGYFTLLGFIFYLGSFILWQKLLYVFDLSYIVPVTMGIIQIIVLVIACVFFKESITVPKLLGVLLVIIGVVLLSIKK